MINFDKDTNAFSIVAKDTGDIVISFDNYLLDEGDIVYFMTTKNHILTIESY